MQNRLGNRFRRSLDVPSDPTCPLLDRSIRRRGQLHGARKPYPTGSPRTHPQSHHPGRKWARRTKPPGVRTRSPTTPERQHDPKRFGQRALDLESGHAVSCEHRFSEIGRALLARDHRDVGNPTARGPRIDTPVDSRPGLAPIERSRAAPVKLCRATLDKLCRATLDKLCRSAPVELCNATSGEQ